MGAVTDRPTVVNTDCRHLKTHYHGTRGSYISDRCRCVACGDANRAYARRYRRLRNDSPKLGDYWRPGSPEWLAAMRLGLQQAVEASVRRHGRVR